MKHYYVFILLTGILFAGCNNQTAEKSVSYPTSYEDSVKQFVYDYVDEIWNKKDFTNAEKYWGPDFRNGFAPQLEHGPEGMKKQIESFLQAFNPFDFEVKEIIIDGDKVAMWFIITATHSGDFMGIKATNKEITFREAAWYEMKDGKFDVVYGFVDWDMVYQQLGQYPGLNE